MFQIDASSAAAFSQGIEKWLLETRNEIVEVYRGLAITMFNYVAWETPQWTGNAAANWNFKVGYPDISIDLSLKTKQSSVDKRIGIGALQKGNPAAVQIATSRNSGRAEEVKDLLRPIYITNSAEGLDGIAYIRMLEENPNNYLRKENEPGAMAAHAVTAASVNLALLSRADIAQLRTVRLGDKNILGIS